MKKSLITSERPNFIRLEVNEDGQELLVRIPFKVTEQKILSFLSTGAFVNGPKEIVKLSKREAEVYQLVMKHKLNKEIASDLNISPRTVKFHVSRLLLKFRVQTRYELGALPEVIIRGSPEIFERGCK